MANHDVPFLRNGMGRTPADGGCIMQVIDWITNNGSWTDRPKCVLPALRDISVAVNDGAYPEQRQQLLPLATRLMHTNPSDPRERVRLDMAIRAKWAELRGLSRLYTVESLVELLDFYDEITGRPTPTETLDFSGVCAAMNA